MHRRRHGLALILLGAALLPWLACSSKSAEVIAAPSPAPSGEPAPAPSANLPASAAGFTVSGPLIVEHELDVLAQRDGVVAELLSDAGAHVRTGDLLAQLDDRQLAADLEAARAKTHSTEADLKAWQAEARVLQSDSDRAQKMWDAQLITREQLDHAKFKAEADRFDVQRVEQLLVNARETQRSLELELEKTRIRAPFSGVVARRYVRQGQQVAKGDRLFWVTAEGPLQMRFTLPEKFIGRIHKGQELPMMTPDLPDQKYKVRVEEVSPVVDPASSTIEVTVELEGKPGLLRPGMDASVNLENLR
ncbi:MAG: efflux RND transporter periplasmic adaptor subunit [Terriglobales bacterium]